MVAFATSQLSILAAIGLHILCINVHGVVFCHDVGELEI